MSSSATKAVSGLIRCKGISKSSGEQCRHKQYDGQYCWTHKDQTITPSNRHAAEQKPLGDANVAISSSNNGYRFFRLRTLLLLGFLASLWLISSVLQLDFSAPEYLGPLDVCATPEPSLDILSQYHPYESPSRLPFEQGPVFEPASLVDHLINETMPTAGTGAQNLTSLQTIGLSMWQSCSKEMISSNSDLRCPFDAFNLLFFGGYLARVNLDWTESTGFPTSLEAKEKMWEYVIYGVTHQPFTPQLHQRFVDIIILSPESNAWHHLGAPNVHGVLLHEMVHAYFSLYACPREYKWDTTDYANFSDAYPYLRNLGITGHGPEWLRLTRTLEKAANKYLGLGEIDLSWRYSVVQELAHVGSLRKNIAGDQRSKHEEVDEHFGKVISDIDDLLGSKA